MCIVGLGCARPLLGSGSAPVPKVHPTGWEIAINSGECKGLYCVMECSHDYLYSVLLRINWRTNYDRKRNPVQDSEHMSRCCLALGDVSWLLPSMKQKPGKMSLSCLCVGIFSNIDPNNSTIFLSTHS